MLRIQRNESRMDTLSLELRGVIEKFAAFGRDLISIPANPGYEISGDADVEWYDCVNDN